MSLFSVIQGAWTTLERPAVIAPGGAVSFRELALRVRRAAAWMRGQGLGEGDVIALQLGRSLALLECFLGAQAAGVATLLLNPAYTPTEVRFYLEDAGARLAVLPARTAVSAQEAGVRWVPADQLRGYLDETTPVSALPLVSPDAVAAVMYTSGTTGRPKGAVIRQRHVLGTVQPLHAAWGWSSRDRLLHALPLFHIHGLFVAQLGALYAGATTVWMDRFDARAALAAIHTHQITVFMGVPTLYARFLGLPPEVRSDLSSMRLFTSGSAPLPARAHADFAARFGHPILERYGMTEVGIVLSNPLDGERRPGTVGGPLPGVEVRILDTDSGAAVAPGATGELHVRGPAVIDGYLGLPEATAAALAGGWMKTGDLGFRDADGYIHLVGRRGDMIISGGLNVYPLEVEAVLMAHPDVGAAAVVGVPDGDLGERVVAQIIPADRPITADLIAWCRERLAPYKCPKVVQQVEDFPRNAMGKVQKARIRKGWGQA